MTYQVYKCIKYFLFPIATNRKYQNGHPYSFQPFLKSYVIPESQ